MESKDMNQGQNSNMESTEYRASLLRKLNCLISVVEVALAKVRVNLQTPGQDVERLTRISLNLENTLNVCRRAKLALERREPLPAGLPGDLSSLSAVQPKPVEKPVVKKAPKIAPLDINGIPHMTYRDYVEFSSVDEFYKFRKLNPIKPEEVKGADIDELARKFGGIDRIA